MVHLSTCPSFWNERHVDLSKCIRAATLFSDRPENINFDERSGSLSTFAEHRSAVPEEKSKMSQPIISQGGHLGFPITTKNKNLVEDVEFLLHVNLCQTPFSGCRGEVKNVSANQRPGRPSLFPGRLEKRKLGREG